MNESIAASQAASIALCEAVRILREAGMLDACQLLLSDSNAARVMDTAVADVRRVFGGELPGFLREQAA